MLQRFHRFLRKINEGPSGPLLFLEYDIISSTNEVNMITFLGVVILILAFYLFARACWIGFFFTPDGIISMVLFLIAMTALDI